MFSIEIDQKYDGQHRDQAGDFPIFQGNLAPSHDGTGWTLGNTAPGFWGKVTENHQYTLGQSLSHPILGHSWTIPVYQSQDHENSSGLEMEKDLERPFGGIWRGPVILT